MRIKTLNLKPLLCLCYALVGILLALAYPVFVGATAKANPAYEVPVDSDDWLAPGPGESLAGSLVITTTDGAGLPVTSDPVVTASFTIRPASGAIQSDDFNACALAEFWTHYPGLPGDPAPVFSGTHVSLSVPAGEDHDIWTNGIHASRIMQTVDNTENFTVEVKFDSQVTAQFQTQGVLIEQANGDALRFEFYSTGVATELFAASIFTGTVPGYVVHHSISTEPGNAGTPPYMRVRRAGNQWTHSYSFDRVTWTSMSAFTQDFTMAQVGVYAGNSSTEGDAPAHTAIIDYFYNTDAPGPGDIDENTLDVQKVGDGTVTRDPNQGAYACGEVITLTATADPHWGFDSWSGDLVESTNPATLTVTGDHVVTATFVANLYDLTINYDGNGIVDRDPNLPDYTFGQDVTLTATADPGWSFDSWGGDLGGSANPDTLTIRGDSVVTATFTQNAYILTVTKVGTGTVSLDPNQSTYTYDQVVTLTATADAGSRFDSWSGDLMGSTNPATLTITGNHAVTATFEALDNWVFLPIVLKP